jgi:hypothetical protein
MSGKVISGSKLCKNDQQKNLSLIHAPQTRLSLKNAKK